MGTPEQYRIVFDISQKPYQWWFPAAGLGISGLGALANRIFSGDDEPKYRRIGGYLVVPFGILWALGVLLFTFPEYHTVQSRYQRGELSIVEGRVTNFRPMP